MKKWIELKSIAVPWTMPNVDTGSIITMERLLLNPDNLDKYAFEPFRYIDGDGDKGELNMEFPLNKPQFRGAKIMIVGENFGCGSSRESAPEAISKMNFRCLIGNSFGSIFEKNCYQKGILPIKLHLDMIKRLSELANNLGKFTVDLKKSIIITPDNQVIDFHIDKIQQKYLIEGKDINDETLSHIESIEHYIKNDRINRPWIYSTK